MNITIYLNKELHEEAKEYANRTGRTISGLVEVSLKKILEVEQNEQL